MLCEFIAAHRDQIIARCQAPPATRAASGTTEESGVPVFLDQLTASLRFALSTNPAIGKSAAQHGSELLHRGFTIAQVVHDYGNICQTITALATELAAPITTAEFRILNRCLDDAIADAVTEYGRVRAHEGSERLGHLAHDLKNLLTSAVLAFDILKRGSVGLSGSTGAVLGRSLKGLAELINLELVEVGLETDVGAGSR